jgi:uncharacterized DUF497 family protein
MNRFASNELPMGQFDHSAEEDRLIIGATNSGQVLVVSHVFREDIIRIKATARERAFYEQQSQHWGNR